MKFIPFMLGLLLITGCATSSTTSSPVNIDGTWEGIYDSGIDGQPLLHLTFNFIRDGDNLGGFVKSNFGPTGAGEETPLEKGKIQGTNISFTSRPKNTKNIFEFKGKVDGDKVKMTFEVKMYGQGWKSSRRDMPRPMIDDLGKHIRSGDWIKGSAKGLSAGVDTLNSRSGEFIIERVKQTLI